MATNSIPSPDPSDYCIYRIVNFRNGKMYVGMTMYEEGRYQWHFEALKKGKHHSQKLQNAYNKYGDNAFYFEVIERNISKVEIGDRERYWIAHYDSFQSGYNMTPGGIQGGNYKPFVLGGVQYESKKAAAEANNMTVAELNHALRLRKRM